MIGWSAEFFFCGYQIGEWGLGADWRSDFSLEKKGLKMLVYCYKWEHLLLAYYSDNIGVNSQIVDDRLPKP